LQVEEKLARPDEAQLTEKAQFFNIELRARRRRDLEITEVCRRVRVCV
jgi:hypothetical protein